MENATEKKTFYQRMKLSTFVTSKAVLNIKAYSF